MTWSKPRNDGGTPVVNYVLEKREKGQDKWSSVSDKVTENELTVRGLQNGKEYEFRVAASNKAGTSKWSQSESPIEARAPDCPPKALGFFNGYKEMVVKAGDTLRISVPFQGSPRPTVAWSKIGEATLPDGGDAKMENGECRLVFDKATIGHAGTYTCWLKNDFGQEKVTIKVVVMDRPGAPQGPLDISDIRPDSCMLTWKPPKVRTQLFQ